MTACAELASRQCPFIAGRRDWRDETSRANPLIATYSAGMTTVLAQNWRSHRDPGGAWHFEAVGPLVRQEPHGAPRPAGADSTASARHDRDDATTTTRGRGDARYENL